MKDQTDIANKLSELKPVLQERFFVEQIGFFGSYARGTQHDRSDVDILVSLRKPLGWEFFDLQDYLEKELGIKVDLVSKKAIKHQLREEILSNVMYI